MTDIYLSVDAGGSQTKVIYQFQGDKKPNYFVLPPEVEEISQAKLDTYMARLGWIGNPTPDQQAWVKWNSRLVVLGDFASQFDPQDHLRELKYENFLWKVLAAVGLIVEKSKFKVSAKKPLLLQLAILLPWNEYNDRKRFEEQLKAMLANFEFRNLKLKVQLEKLLCRPEGGGLAAIRIKKQGIDWLQQRQLGVLMFGHRNTTALYFDRGQLKSGDSPLLGFSAMLDQVVSMVSGLDRERLATAIFKGMHVASNEIYNTDYKYTRHPTWEKLEAILALASARDASLRTREVRDIVKALQIATVDYWEKLERWLKKTLPERLDEVIVGGGAAYFIEPELEQYFNCEPQTRSKYSTSSVMERTGTYTSRDWRKHQTDMIWGAGIQEVVEKTFDFPRREGSEQRLSARLVDCFGLFDSLIGQEGSGGEKS